MTAFYNQRPSAWPACLTEAVPAAARKAYLLAEQARAKAVGASRAAHDARQANAVARQGDGNLKPSVAADRMHAANRAAEEAASAAHRADADLADAMADPDVAEALQAAEAVAWTRLEAAAKAAEAAASDAAALGVAVLGVQAGTPPSQWRWPQSGLLVDMSRLVERRPQAVAARRRAEEAERAREAAKPQTRDGIHLPGRRSFAT